MDSNLTLCERSNHRLHSEETDRSVGEIQALRKSQRIGLGGTIVMCNIQGVRGFRNRGTRPNKIQWFFNVKVPRLLMTWSVHTKSGTRTRHDWKVYSERKRKMKCSDGGGSIVEWRRTKSGKWSWNNNDISSFVFVLYQVSIVFVGDTRRTKEKKRNTLYRIAKSSHD